MPNPQSLNSAPGGAWGKCRFEVGCLGGGAWEGARESARPRFPSFSTKDRSRAPSQALSRAPSQAPPPEHPPKHPLPSTPSRVGTSPSTPWSTFQGSGVPALFKFERIVYRGGIGVGVKGVMGRDAIVHKRRRNCSQKATQ